MGGETCLLGGGTYPGLPPPPPPDNHQHCYIDAKKTTLLVLLQELRGSALGIYYFGIYIGYSLAFAIGNSIDQVLGWRWVFYLSGLAGVAVAPIVLFTVREPKRTVSKTADHQKKEDDKISVLQRFVLLLLTFIMPGMFILCIAGGLRNAGGYVWAYNTQIFFQKFYSKSTIRNFMSWIPLVGGSLGAVVGGVISDVLVKGRGTTARIWVLVISQVITRGW